MFVLSFKQLAYIRKTASKIAVPLVPPDNFAGTIGIQHWDNCNTINLKLGAIEHLLMLEP